VVQPEPMFVRAQPMLNVVRLVTVPSAGEVFLCEGGDDALWFVKKTPNSGALADWIGLSLVRALGGPVPDVAVARFAAPDRCGLDGRIATREVADYTHWMPGRWDSIENAQELAVVALVDALLDVDDRHSRNLLLQPLAAHSFRVLAIDFDNAALMSPDRLTDTFRAPAENPWPIDGVRKDTLLTAMASLVEHPGLEHVRDIVTAGGHHWPHVQLEEIADALEERCERAADLVAAFIDRWN